MLSFPDLFKQHRPPSTPFPEASEISPAHHAEVEVDKDRDRDAEGWGRSERIDNQCLKQRLTGRQAVTRARVVGWGRKGVAFEAHRLGRHCPSCPRVHSVVDRRRVHYSMHDEEKNSRALLWAHWKFPSHIIPPAAPNIRTWKRRPVEEGTGFVDALIRRGEGCGRCRGCLTSQRRGQGDDRQMVAARGITPGDHARGGASPGL